MPDPIDFIEEPLDSSHYAATAVYMLREQYKAEHKRQSAQLFSNEDIVLKFDASAQQGVSRLLKALFNKNTYERKVPEGADEGHVLSIANMHLPEGGTITLPDNETRELAVYTGGAPQFTHLDQLVALGQDIAAHPAKEATLSTKPATSGRRGK